MSIIKVKNKSYQGWLQAIEISNLEIQVIITPETGRIIFFGFLNAENIFYENKGLQGIQFKTGSYFKKEGMIQAPNIGGNRVLPCSEEYFESITGSRHIPDPLINASAYKVTYLKNGIILKSPVSKLLGIQIIRTITICDTGSEVKIQQELKKINPAKHKKLENIPLTIWSLSKIKNPNTCFTSISENSIFNKGYTISKWPDAKNNAKKNLSINQQLLALKSSKNLPQKIGVDAKKWVAAYLKKSLFIERFNFEPTKTYPDFGTSVTIFGNEMFSELECLSPETLLNVGESITYDLSWELIKVNNKKQAIQLLKNL